MIALQKERESRLWSKLRLSQEARVAPSIVGQTESGRRTPYAPELARMAAALEWQGDPHGLLVEVGEAAALTPELTREERIERAIEDMYELHQWRRDYDDERDRAPGENDVIALWFAILDAGV